VAIIGYEKMTTIETERLVIRNFKVSDCEALHEMIIQYESSEYAVYDHEWPTSPQELKGVTEWFASGDSFLAVCLKDTGRFIGFVSLNQEQIEVCREFNLGYIFNFDYHGKGYGTEACRAILAHAFDGLQADRVITGTAAANRPSWHLLEKLGLKRTVESTGSFRNTPDGKPIQFLGYNYAISRDEWKTADKNG
jgi:RimJ/RimL family protein N-acetyltransferase